jgi:WD40 repeat protein
MPEYRKFPVTTYYETLGVERNADLDDLRNAYRNLARKYHPDVNPDPNSHERMAKINEAFQTLIDPERRKEYDAMLGGAYIGVGAPRRVRRPKAPVAVSLFHRLDIHRTPVYALTFDIETGDLISGAFDNELIWWNPESGELTRRHKLESGLISMMRSVPGGKVLVAGASESQVSFCQVSATGSDLWRNHALEWAAIAEVSPNGEKLAMGTVHRNLVMMDIATGSIRYTKSDHSGSITAIAWSADGKYLATGSADASVKLRHAETGEVIYTFQPVRSTVTAVTFSPDNSVVAVAAVDLSIRIFSLVDGQLTKVMTGHTKPIECLAFHPNGWLVASGGRDGIVGLWNAQDGIGQAHLEASARPILSVAFNKDGSLLASSGLDKMVRLWRVSAKNSK